MLDKTVPYYSIIMRRKGGLPAPRAVLPDGYFFSTYQQGDEAAWSEIEASVAEFDGVPDALLYFRKEYAPFSGELKRRMIFIRSSTGEPVATALDWWHDTGGVHTAALHWVAVRTDCQGRGLGKALVAESVRRMILLEGGADIYLHTQTWSYKAVWIYQRAGFEILKSGSFHKYLNDYEKALPILKEKMGNRLCAT